MLYTLTRAGVAIGLPSRNMPLLARGVRCRYCGLVNVRLSEHYRNHCFFDIPRDVCPRCPLRVVARNPCGIRWRRWPRSALTGDTVLSEDAVLVGKA